MPKIMEPTERSISTRVMPHEMSALDLPKVVARSPTVRLTVKKSNESHDYRGAPIDSAWVPSLSDAPFWGGSAGHTYPGDEADGEKGPLATAEQREQAEGVRGAVHRRLEGREARGQIATDRGGRGGVAVGKLFDLLRAGRGGGGGGLFGVGHRALEWDRRVSSDRFQRRPAGD